jgi:hypothetical protein
VPTAISTSNAASLIITLHSRCSANPSGYTEGGCRCCSVAAAYARAIVGGLVREYSIHHGTRSQPELTGLSTWLTADTPREAAAVAALLRHTPVPSWAV